jgi:hypothetical protein
MLQLQGSDGMDWTMPAAFMHTKAFAMNANNDVGNMVKMQVGCCACC